MVQKIHLWGVIWVPSNRPQAGHLSEKKNDNLAVQYEDVNSTEYLTSAKLKITFFKVFFVKRL